MLGEFVDVSKPCTAPERIEISGKYIKLVPWLSSHTREIWPLLDGPENEIIWKYWPVGPYASLEAYEADMSPFYDKTDPIFWAITDLKSGRCLGMAAIGEVDVSHRNIECGMFLSLALQRSTGSTEAYYLMARYAFDLGYRRLSWKTSSVNWPSRRAAERFGMTFEGVWRQHKIEKGRNRDSAWYSVIDGEWPVRKLAFERWLSPENFDAEGRQKTSLVEVRKQLEAEGTVAKE